MNYIYIHALSEKKKSIRNNYRTTIEDLLLTLILYIKDRVKQRFFFIQKEKKEKTYFCEIYKYMRG